MSKAVRYIAALMRLFGLAFSLFLPWRCWLPSPSGWQPGMRPWSRRRWRSGTPEQLVQLAEQALYRAKVLGRNRVLMEVAPSRHGVVG